MITLKGDNIYIRALEPNDLEFIYAIENKASIALFTKFGFKKIGIKKDWNLINGSYKDEVLFQLINNHSSVSELT